MKIRRRADGRNGWAVQMAGRYIFDGVSHPAGSWVVDLEGAIWRFVVSSDRMRWDYQPSTSRLWPPLTVSAAGVWLLGDSPSPAPTARVLPDRP